MKRFGGMRAGIAGLLVAAGILLQYLGALGTGFLNDDYLFLEQARSQPLLSWLFQPDALGNYYRPLSRQLYFSALAPLGAGQPLLFHGVNAVLFAAALTLLADLLAALLPPAGVMAGVLYFALLPLQRVNLTWISCSQDLLALAFALAAVALFRRGRLGWAALAYLGAVAAKESALPLPLALLAWCVWIERRAFGNALRRVAPMAALGLAWGALALGVATRRPPSAGALHFAPAQFAAALVHGLQSLFGLDHPPGVLGALAAARPALAPLVLLAAAAWLTPAAAREGQGAPARGVVALAAAWFAAFALLTGPVAAIWSGYFYTLAAVGGALAVGLAFRRADRWVLAGLAALLVWWNTGTGAVRAFAVTENPWGWTSHLTASYFERAARLTRELSDGLCAAEPAPPRGASLFFATLPPWAGFQMGNGALVRTLYRDSTLRSYFYSQFSESTAADRPCLVFYWDGATVKPMYRRAADPFFQIGTDQLLFERPAAAAHAFRRALLAGGRREDNLYWLGFSELEAGRRDEAESAWQALGAADDSLRWALDLHAALAALHERRDTLAARRDLARALGSGIGRPEAHAVLGELLLEREPKYAMLELQVACRLNFADWASRRLLVAALARTGMDEPARRELRILLEQRPELASDPLMTEARARLAPPPTAGVVEL